MKKFVFFLFAFVAHRANGLKTISDEDFARFPPISYMDRYTACVMEEGGVFCTAHADLYADEPNELLSIMQNYSASSIRHLNYTTVTYGYCVTRRCKEYYSGNSTSELHATMEACLSEDFNEYNLKARITRLNCYQNKEQKHSIDGSDKVAIIVIAFILFMSALGTVCDVCGTEKKSSFILCFSLRANWNKFKAPWPTDPKSEQMRALNGMRVLTSLMVVLSHVIIPKIVLVENPEFVENKMEDWGQQPLIHIHLVMQTFFFLSGLLMAYGFQNTSQKVPITWTSYPKAVLLRWLRLIPVSGIILMLTSTVMRFSPVGPVWQEMVADEVVDCRKNWMVHLLGYNNYADNSLCHIQTWSNACDLQLHMIGAAVLILSPNKTVRNIALWLLFIVGVVILGVVTYTHDLNGGFISTPEMVRNLAKFVDDPTFKHFYQRTHTNIPCFVIGMAMGLMIYEWQKKPIQEADSKKYQKYMYYYWCLPPLMLLVSGLNGIITVRDGPTPLNIRLAIGVLQKPLWGLLLSVMVMGLIFKVETVPLFRGVLESHFWVPLAKLTYCVYNIHVVLIRMLSGENVVLGHISEASLFDSLMSITTFSYMLALVLWLLVEAPVNNLCRLMFQEKRTAIVYDQTTKDETAEIKKDL